MLFAVIAQAQKAADTVELYFDLGISSLRTDEQRRIDSLIYHNILQPGKKLAIVGYADYVGGDTANLRLIPGGIPEPVKAADKPKRPVIDISNVKKNEAIRLDNIFFLPGSHRWTEASKPALQKLLATLKEYPNVKIRIEGHICCVLEGTTDGYDFDADDFRLSHNRARAVYDYLVKNGIAAERLSSEGFGKSRPLVRVERSPEDENRNRRVEIRILEK